MFTRATSSFHVSNQSKELSLNSYEFFEAIKTGDIEKCRQFFYDPNMKAWELRDDNNYTILHFAVFKNNYDLTLLILEEIKKGLGINSSKKLSDFINSKNKEGITALHYSVINGNIKIFQLLKKFGGNLEAVTNSGKNVMHLAAESNQPSMLLYLYLEEAQDISSIDENGSTPLHWACYYKAEECVNYLLHLNVDINAQDKERLTPLNIAVSNNKPSLVKLLVRNGADKKLKNKNNKFPIDIANQKHYTKLIEILNSNSNPLFSLKMPYIQIKPTDAYKRFILILLIICEVIIIIFVLPFLESLAYYIINFIFFGLCLIFYFILSFSEPGYQKNKELVNLCNGEENYKCLKKLIDDGEDLKRYCPVCYVVRGNNIKHCYICNKCVKDRSHHCIWFNKCIGKKNLIIYIIFIFIAFINCIYSIFICTNLIFDTVSIPYKSLFPSWFYLGIDRGFRVLGASIVSIIAMICSYPLFFLFMIEMFKLCGLLGRKNRDIENLIVDEKININTNSVIDENNKFEMKDKIDLNNEDKEEDEKNDMDKDNKINLPEDNFPIVRETFTEKQEIQKQNEIIENKEDEN